MIEESWGLASLEPRIGSFWNISKIGRNPMDATTRINESGSLRTKSEYTLYGSMGMVYLPTFG